jgi:Transposase IS66 family
MAFPSTASTRRTGLAAGVRARAAAWIRSSHARIHAHTTSSKAFASTRTSNRQIVTDPGTFPVNPNAVRVSPSRSEHHSPIAANERAPASIAHTTRASTAVNGYLTPRRARGSGTRPSASSNDSRSRSVITIGVSDTPGDRPKAWPTTAAVRQDDKAGTVLHADPEASDTSMIRAGPCLSHHPGAACRTLKPAGQRPIHRQRNGPGLRVAGKLHWVHCARTGKYTVITCHPKRGSKGIDDVGVLTRFRGVAVHDAWAPYDTYTDARHQLCCAHAQRELQAVADAAAPDADWCWAAQAADALVAMQKLVAEAIAAGADAVDPQALDEQVRLYRSAAQIGITQTAARSSKVMKKHNALAHRLLDRQDDYLRFTTDWRIPPDNNGSERDIRMIKLRQKVSGCLRTLTGAKQFCAIRSYLSTAAKHGKHFFEVLVMLTEGRPWLPANC